MRAFVLLPALVLVACDPKSDTGDTSGEGLHGRLTEVDGIRVLYLEGERYEMGYAEGVLLCDTFAPLFKAYILDHLVANYGVPYDLVLALVENAVAMEPADEEELQGIWDGASATCTEEQLWVESENLEVAADGARALIWEDLVAVNALADYGCSSFSVWGEASATGDTIHARNFDWAIDPGGEYLRSHLIKVYDSPSEGGARWLSLNVPALVGCITCFTEEGVGLTMHNVGGLEPTQQTGISPRMLAARAALTATWGADDLVTDAEAQLESRPQRVGNNLHLSFPTARRDGQGAVVFEYDGASDHADGQATQREPGEDPELTTQDGISCTNHYLKRTEPETSGDSWQRLDTLRTGIDAAVANGGLDADDAHALIGSVANEYTAHSVIMDQANRELRVFVAPQTGTPATEAEPVVFDLDALFSGSLGYQPPPYTR